MVVIDLVFAIWAGIGKAWYIYPLNFMLLFLASGIINTSYIQGLTRGASYLSLYGIKGVSKAFILNILTIIFMLIAYLITRFVFLCGIQYLSFFGVCIIFSTIVAFIDNHFKTAIEKTKNFERIQEKNLEGVFETISEDKEMPIIPLAIIKRMKHVPKIIEWSRRKHLTISGPKFWGIYHIFINESLKHVILLPKADLTTHVLIGTPTEAREYRKYDKEGKLIFSKRVDGNAFKWKIYKDYILYRGHGLPPKEIPEEPYVGKVMKVEAFNDDINDQWIVSKIKELYNK